MKQKLVCGGGGVRLVFQIQDVIKEYRTMNKMCFTMFYYVLVLVM
jgi:hypothetical protein